MRIRSYDFGSNIKLLGQALQKDALTFIPATSICLLLVLALIVGKLFNNERNEATLHAHKEILNLTNVFQHEIERNFEFYAQSLEAVVEGWRNEKISALPIEVKKAAIFERALKVRHVLNAIVFDRYGNMVFDVMDADYQGLNVFDREYFQEYAASDDHGLHISNPFHNRFDGMWTVAVSRRLNDTKGNFDGIAVIYLDNGFFQGLLDTAEIGVNSRAYIFGPNGRLFAGSANELFRIGDDKRSSEIFQSASDIGQGFFKATSLTDGLERTYYFTYIQHLDMRVGMGIFEDDAYVPWRQQTIPVAVALILYSVFFLFLSFTLGRALQARWRAENELGKIAHYDALTGLSNRRALDSILEDETKRALRLNEPTAILFIDVDFFKQFNDTQGHDRGDQVLREVSLAMRRSLLRPTDKVGRYGGEEFMIVLGQTGRRGAMKVAERVRQAVIDMNIVHPTSNFGVVTISIGIAILQSAKGNIHDTVKMADVALYAAKKQGRNSISFSSED